MISFSAAIAPIHQMSIEDHLADCLQRVEDNANPIWKEKARYCLELICENRSEFTSDTLWQYMDAMYPNVSTKNHSAMGAIICRAAKDGLCRPTGHYIPSVRKSAHKRKIGVWESKLYSYTLNSML